MKKEDHIKNVDELNELENELIELISNAGDSELMDKFIKWQEQRNVCNEGYLKFIESIVDDSDPNGISIIAAERNRQIETEGWTPEHDDEHFAGELALAAACYAMSENQRMDELAKIDNPMAAPECWPWSKSWWKPTPDDRIKELAKAGALIAAEIDRLKRIDQ